MAHVDVNGLPTWHEVHGDGPVVVLLHGAFGGASSWAAQAPVLARVGYRCTSPSAGATPTPATSRAP